MLHLIADALREVSIPFHGKIPKPGSWHHFHDNPAKKGGPYFMRLCRVSFGGKSFFLFIAGDMRRTPPTLVRQLYDENGEGATGFDRGDLESEFKVFEAELEQKLKLKNDTAAIEAERIWEASSTGGVSSYMREKNIDQLYGGRISAHGHLVVPLRDAEGKLWNLQFISKTGERGKHFLTGGKKKGCFHLIGEEIIREIMVVEGFATGVSVHKATGEMVCVALDAGNLRSVCLALKKKFRQIPIRICADRDETGLEKAKAAAMAVGGDVIVPNFGFEHPDYKDFNDLELNEAHGGVTVKDQFDQRAPVRATSFSFSKQDWLREYLEKHQIEFLYDGRVLCHGADLRLMVLRARMYLESEREGLKIGEKLIDSFLIERINSVKAIAWEEVRSKISRFDPLGLEEAKTFLEALTGKREDPESLSVFLHFIWQVKRKLIDLPIDYHMMLVFEGETGGGKSEAITKLLSPLSPLHQRESMDALSDSRRWDIFDRFLVLNMDEMERADKTDLAGLKRTITSDSLSFRILGSHMQQTVSNKTTLLGSTNQSLDDLIKDPTSIRRFYSIQTLGKFELPKNWATINKLDYVKLWTAVDPEKPTPLASNLRAVQDRQEEMRFKDSVELWCEEFEVSHSEATTQTDLSYERSYCLWAASSGLMAVSKIHFSRRLAKLGYKPARIGSKQSRGFHLQVNDPRISR